MKIATIFHPYNAPTGELLFEDDRAGATVPAAISNTLQDWLALELTAERMAEDKILLVNDYISSEGQGLMEDAKASLLLWESGLGSFLLKAADPTTVDWEQNHWWVHDDNNVGDLDNGNKSRL